MEIPFNPSALINSLEYNLYKGISRSKTGNQQQIEACILETDKITEQKSAAYRTEAWVMVACAVGMIAFAMIGVAAELRLASTEGALNQLKCGPRLMDGDTQIKDLTEKLSIHTARKNTLNTVSQTFDRGSNIYSQFSKISHNQLDHESQKKQMRLQQLQQERSNSADRSLLEEIKDLKRRQQQAKAAAG
ncbi:MAG: hypothetical protein WBD50_06475 [Candidatus Rhabdochlamydia sp.]